MRYRSKANPRVTIEAVQVPAFDGPDNEEFADFIMECGHVKFVGANRIHIIGFGEEEERIVVEGGDWVLRDVSGFVSKATHEEFEAAWEPIE